MACLFIHDTMLSHYEWQRLKYCLSLLRRSTIVQEALVLFLNCVSFEVTQTLPKILLKENQCGYRRYFGVQ